MIQYRWAHTRNENPFLELRNDAGHRVNIMRLIAYKHGSPCPVSHCGYKNGSRDEDHPGHAIYRVHVHGALMFRGKHPNQADYASLARALEAAREILRADLWDADS